MASGLVYREAGYVGYAGVVAEGGGQAPAVGSFVHAHRVLLVSLILHIDSRGGGEGHDAALRGLRGQVVREHLDLFPFVWCV